MGDDSLLDQMLDDHVVREREAPKKRAAVNTTAAALDEARIARSRDQRKADLEAAERRTRNRAGNSAPEIAGFRQGERFTLKSDRPELRGTWVVVRVEPGAAGDQSRRLFAQRAQGGDGFMPLTERQVQDLLYARLLSRA